MWYNQSIPGCRYVERRAGTERDSARGTSWHASEGCGSCAECGTQDSPEEHTVSEDKTVYSGQPSPGSKVDVKILQEAGGVLPDRNADKEPLTDVQVLSKMQV